VIPELYPAFSATTTQSTCRQYQLGIELKRNLLSERTSGLFFMFKRMIWKKSRGLVVDLEEADERLGEPSDILIAVEGVVLNTEEN